MSLTADDVENTVFDTAALGRRGYARAEVDNFLRRIGDTLAGRDDLTAAEVHHVEFSRPLQGGGYDQREVHRFLDRVEDELLRRSGRAEDYHVPRAREGEHRREHAPRLCPEDVASLPRAVDPGGAGDVRYGR